MREIRDYYEKEALKYRNHQEEMYSADPWNAYWHGARLRQVLQMAKGILFRKLLDVGCAEGYYLRLLGRPSNDIEPSESLAVGMDIARNYLLKAKIRKPDSSLVVGDATKLPFDEDIFDLVLCSEVLEHVLDMESAFRELVRVSKNYILLTLAGENLFFFLAKKLKLLKARDPYLEIGHGHVNEGRITETIIPWALEIGCAPVESMVTCYFPLSFFKKNRAPTFIIPIIKLADSLINKLPVLRELGAVQIVLLKKASGT